MTCGSHAGGCKYPWLARAMDGPLVPLCGALRQCQPQPRAKEGKISNTLRLGSKAPDTCLLPPIWHLVRGCESEFRICAAQSGQGTAHPNAINNGPLRTLPLPPPPATAAGGWEVISFFVIRDPSPQTPPSPHLCTAWHVGSGCRFCTGRSLSRSLYSIIYGRN